MKMEMEMKRNNKESITKRLSVQSVDMFINIIINRDTASAEARAN